jgi:CubicO group peptidase (beta-lactamase class C family)
MDANLDLEKGNLNKNIKKKITDLLKSKVSNVGPGVALAIMHKGKLIFDLCIGYSNIQTKEKLTINSRFDLASLSKHFTGAAIILLLREKLISLDDPVSKYIKELAVERDTREILIRDLVYMISGHADYINNEVDLKVLKNEEIAKIVANKPLIFPTGTKYQYSNTDYPLIHILL